MSSAREAGYRLLGRRLDYLLHLRPAEWPIMAAHTAVGYLLAVGLRRRRAQACGSRPALVGLVLWVVCLNGGTLALNSAFDRDEGDIAYLRRPPVPPRHLAAFSIALMAPARSSRSGCAAPYPMAYAVCFVLSLAYSVPPLRLKAVAGADWIINMWGFGTLTPPRAGPRPGMPIDAARGLVLLAFCPLFAALYPLTQLYQLEEDTRRGDRTLACVLGVRRSLSAAIGAAALAFALFAAAGIRAGWRAGGAGPLALGRRSAAGARGVGRGAAAMAAAAGRAWRRPITSGACTARSVPGPSPTSSWCSAGAPDRPLARPAAAAYTSPPPHSPRRRHALGSGTARGPRPDGHPCDRARRGQARAARVRHRAGGLARVALLPNGVLQTAVLGAIVLVGLVGGHLLPGLWTRPRTIEGIAGAAGIGLARGHRVPAGRRHAAAEHRHVRPPLVGPGRRQQLVVPPGLVDGRHLPSVDGRVDPREPAREGERRVARRRRSALALGCARGPRRRRRRLVHFPGAAWGLGTFGVAFLPGVALATVISGLGAKRA